MILNDRQWKALGIILGGKDSYTNSLSGHSYITLQQGTWNSYILTYNNNIEVTIHKNVEVSNYDISYLHTLWNLWVKDKHSNFTATI